MGTLIPGRAGNCAALAGALLLAGAFACASAQGATRSVYDVRSFGAATDGRKLDTGAINAAIRACARAGGGTVQFGPGVYRTGTIEILSHVTLSLLAGARILGSPDAGDYRSIGRSTEGRSTALIVAEDATDIAIQGPGTIDGNGRAFVRQPPRSWPSGTGRGFYDPAATRQGRAFEDRGRENREGPDEMLDRPGVLVLLVQCRGVAMRDLAVVDAPNWCIHLAGCRSAVLDGLDVRNSLRIPNADAVDVASSQDIHVSNCHLEAGDDGFAVSPCADGYCPMVAENITVSHCEIVSRSAGVRLGWAAMDIRNLRFDHLTIRNSNRGIGIFVRGSETIEDVLFSDITIETRLVDGQWWGLGEPIHISVMPYNLSGAPGQVRTIRFVNVTSTSGAPTVLYSQPRGLIRDIVFEGCTQTIREGGLDRYYGGNLDLRPVTPDSLGIIRHDLAGVVARGVDGLDLRGLSLVWSGAAPAYFTAGAYLTDCRGPKLEGFRERSPPPGTPLLRVDGDGR